MSAWFWIGIIAAVVLLIVLVILFARERGKNKKPATIPTKQAPDSKIVFKTSRHLTGSNCSMGV